MAAQGAVQRIELFAAGGAHGESQPQVFPAGAFPRLQFVARPVGVELANHMAHGLEVTLDFQAHDLDGKIAGILNQAVFVGWRGIHKLRLTISEMCQ